MMLQVLVASNKLQHYDVGIEITQIPNIIGEQFVFIFLS